MTRPSLSVFSATDISDGPTSVAALSALTDDVEFPIDIQWGRHDEQSQADPNTASFVVRTSSFSTDATYGVVATGATTGRQIRIGTPVEVRATSNSGAVTSTRFHGCVSEISPFWPSGAMDGEQYVRVQALSRLGWVARAQEIQDRASASMIAAGATSYWALSQRISETDSGTGYTASPEWFDGRNAYGQSDSGPSGTGDDGLRFGVESAYGETVTAPDGLPFTIISAHDKSSAYGLVKVRTELVTPIAASAAFSVHALVWVPPATGGASDSGGSPEYQAIALNTDIPGSEITVIWLTIPDVGLGWAMGNGATIDETIDTAPYDLRDGSWHSLVFTCSGGASPTVTLYADGLEVLSGAWTTALPAIRQADFGIYAANGVPFDLTGLARVAFFDGVALSPATVAQIHDDIFVGFNAEDDVSERIATWFDYAGMPATALTVTDGGDTPLLAQEPAGVSPLSLMQDVAKADRGMLVDIGAETCYLGRNVRLSETTATATLSVTNEALRADFSPMVDLQALVNDITVEASDNSKLAQRDDTASIANFGYAGVKDSLLTASLPHLTGLTDWAIHTGRLPKARVPSLSIELGALTNSEQDAVLQLEPWSLLELTGLPSSSSAVPAKFFVEGGAEAWSAGECVLSLNVTDATNEQTVFLLDDATRGVLDSTTHVLG